MNCIKVMLLTGILLVVSTLYAHAADVTITVNGRVVARPCIVSTSSATVILGDMFASNYIQAGSTSAWRPVTLMLTNCPVGTSRVTATFTGPTDNTGYYENQGDALNIQLELSGANENTLNSGSSTTVRVNESTQSASLSLRVRALSVKGNARPGTIKGSINVTYTYS